ncbi:MAG: DUF4190 domain-containing protein [Planctomycetota bacterium]
MTQYPDSPLPPSMPYDGEPTPQKNGWGLAGFIVSIVSLVACGVPSIVGLILSIVGLTRKDRPKGLAIAGTIISVLGIVLAIGVVLAVLGLKDAFVQGGAAGMAHVDVVDFYQQNGRLPDEAEYDAMLKDAASILGWGNVEYEYTPISESEYRLTLPSLDGQLNTADDIDEVFDATDY